MEKDKRKVKREEKSSKERKMPTKNARTKLQRRKKKVER
jgi:hypothetical protein